MQCLQYVFVFLMDNFGKYLQKVIQQIQQINKIGASNAMAENYSTVSQQILVYLHLINLLINSSLFQ